MSEAEALMKYELFLWKQVHAFARQAQCQTIPLDDFMQEARIAFLLHIRTHDESMWAACTLTIRGALFDYVRRNYPLSISRCGFKMRLTRGTTFAAVDQVTDECGIAYEDDHSGMDLMTALQRLNPKERELIGMRLEGLTIMEIASKEGMTYHGIRYRLKVIRQKAVAKVTF